MTPIVLRLKYWREKRGLSQLALADLAGVRQATISEMETGAARRVGLDVLDRLCTALDIQPGQLIKQNGE